MPIKARLLIFIKDEIERLRVWEKRGFSSIYEYAAKLARMSHRKMSKHTLEAYVREIRTQNVNGEHLSPRGDVVYLDNVENVQLKNSLKNTSNQIMIKKMDLALKEYAPTQNN